MSAPLEPTTGYVSPFGKADGLLHRLDEWRGSIARDRSAPWFGLGLISDLEFIMRLLKTREFAEWLRASGPPEYAELADQIERDDETIEALGDALKRAGLTNYDPVAAVETLQRERDRANPQFDQVRQVLVDIGALAPEDRTTSVPDLVRALLS